VLGVDIPMEQAKRHLQAAGFEITSSGKDALEARVPSWRVGDVSQEIDLVEEIARFHGYDKLPDEIRPFRPTNTFDSPLWTLSNRIRDLLVGEGLLEARPVPFIAAGDSWYVRVQNPLSEAEAYLRKFVTETLAKRAEYNLAQRTGDVRLFEIGSAFMPTKTTMPRETLCVGMVIAGRRRPPHFTEPEPPVYDEWDAKALGELVTSVAYPGATIEMQTDSAVLWFIRVNGQTQGVIQRLEIDAPIWAPPVYGIDIALAVVDSAQPAERGQHSYMEGARPARVAPGKYKAIPTMPPAEIDLALLVPDGTTVADVERVIRASSGELLERLDLFDQYTGEGVPAGHRSLAWRLTFRHAERTLRDKEIEGRRAKVVGALQQELNVRQR
jgi:phenylalanyl-tRNA synthetase beta chain